MPRLFWVLLLVVPTLAQEPGPDLDKLHDEAMACWQTEAWERALELYGQILAVEPGDTIAHYNAACAHALLGQKAEAVASLRQAVEHGYLDFRHLQSDSDLDAIREEPGYLEIMAEQDRWQAQAAEKRVERWREKLSPAYQIIRDEEYKLILISDVDEATRGQLQNALQRYAASHAKDFFKFPPDDYLTVLIPSTPEEYRDTFGGGDGAAGFYQHATRTLTVSLATGTGTMIHEYTHALHYGDMEGLGQDHPQWLIEGFGSLFEQCHQREGSGYGLLNWRLPILKRAIEAETIFPLEDFLADSEACFDADQSVAYAQARYLLFFLQEKGLLRSWYAAYREDYADDPSGRETLERIYGSDLAQLQEDWLAFIEPLSYGRAPAPARPWMGVGLEDLERGLRITSLGAGSPAERAGLQEGDVLLAVDGEELESVEELLGLLDEREVGDVLELRVERGDDLGLELRLVLDRRPRE